jgi:hypothetical protein
MEAPLMQVPLLGTFTECKENMYTEYKEFCIKDGLYVHLSDEEISSIIRTGALPRKFNKIVLSNIFKYITVYLSKYASSYHNSCTKKKAFNFTIGIDDECEITGIPLLCRIGGCRGMEHILEELEIAIKAHCLKVLQHKMCNTCCLKVDVKTIKCEVDQDLLEDETISKKLHNYDKNKKWFAVRYKKYAKKKRKWTIAILKYKSKLQSVLADDAIKAEFISFLKDRKLYELYQEKLNDSTYIIDVDKIKEYKKEPSTFIYWLILFKDMKVDALMMIKPIPPMMLRCQQVEYCALTHLSDIRYRLIANNKNLHYFLMVIHITKDIPDCNVMLKYRDDKRNHWRKLSRCIEKNTNMPVSKDF